MTRTEIYWLPAIKFYNVILDCKTVNSDEDYVEPTIRALNEVLGIDEETVRSLLADSRTSQSQYQVLTKQLSMDKKKEFEKYKAEDEDSGLTKAQAKERANIKGVWFEEDYLRSYPFNETACDTIGLHWTEMWQISDWKGTITAH